MGNNKNFFDDCLVRLITAGICPYRAYDICKKFEKKGDVNGLLKYVTLAEFLNYDDTREYVD